MRFEDVKIGMRVRHVDGSDGIITELHPTERIIYCNFEGDDGETVTYADYVEPIKDTDFHKGYLTGLEAAKQTIQTRFMGDMNREDVEVKKCIALIQQLIDDAEKE